jgi:hypothetical protein
VKPTSANSNPAISNPSVSNNDVPSATHDHEWSVLLAACSLELVAERNQRLHSLLRRPVHWQSLFDLAQRHGVQQLVYVALAAGSAPIAAEQMPPLQQIHQLNLRKALLLSRELIRIVDHLSALGIETMPYKGLALAEALYGDIALRQSGDIDLLIRRQDFCRVRDAVRDIGFTSHSHLSAAQERAHLKSGYEYSFDGAAGPNLLEVQWAVQPRFYSIDFDMDGIFERAVTVNVAGHAMKTPSPEDLFLVLSAHAAKHVWGRLIWLCDLARIMTLPNLDWEWIASQANELGIARIMGITMVLANRLLGAAIPSAAAQAGFKFDDTETAAFGEEIQTHMAGENAYNVESLAYFRLMLRLRERASDRRRFLWRLVFTPGPGEWDAVPLPAPLFPLYRLVRLSRLAARLLRQ